MQKIRGWTDRKHQKMEQIGLLVRVLALLIWDFTIKYGLFGALTESGNMRGGDVGAIQVIARS